MIMAAYALSNLNSTPFGRCPAPAPAPHLLAPSGPAPFAPARMHLESHHLHFILASIFALSRFRRFLFWSLASFLVLLLPFVSFNFI